MLTEVEKQHTKLDWLKIIKLDISNIPDNRYNLHQDNQCGPERRDLTVGCAVCAWQQTIRLRKGD